MRAALALVACGAVAVTSAQPLPELCSSADCASEDTVLLQHRGSEVAKAHADADLADLGLVRGVLGTVADATIKADGFAQESAGGRASVTVDSRIVIVGGGAAGIHMASRLLGLGFKSVVVLERNPDTEEFRFGKAGAVYEFPETGDTPHAMGAYSLLPWYNNTFSLVREYLGEDALITPGGELFEEISVAATKTDKLKCQRKAVRTPEAWLLASYEANKMPGRPGLWKKLPDWLQLRLLVRDFRRYRSLHESLLGAYDYHGLPPKPTLENLRKINCTFYDLMIRNRLKGILDLVSFGAGAYGLSHDIPALYGLWIITPISIEVFLEPSVDLIQTLRDGFRSLWAAMVQRHSIDIRYGTEIETIDRHLEDTSRPIEVRLASGSTMECDHLIFAAPMHREFLRVVKDATTLEREVTDAIGTSSLVVSLLRTAKKETAATPQGERALTYYPNALMPEFFPDPQRSRMVYVERNSIRTFRPELEASTPMRYTTAFQYLPRWEEGADQAAVPMAIAQLTSTDWVVDPTPAKPAPEVLVQKNWEWFPRFSQQAVQRFLPWRLMEAQGEHRTWYIGSSCSMELVEDVLHYNDMVLRQQLPDMQASLRRRHAL